MNTKFALFCFMAALGLQSVFAEDAPVEAPVESPEEEMCSNCTLVEDIDVCNNCTECEWTGNATDGACGKSGGGSSGVSAGIVVVIIAIILVIVGVIYYKKSSRFGYKAVDGAPSSLL